LAAHEAANELGYHIKHLFELLRSGKVQAQQFNRVLMIDPQEVGRIKALQGLGGRLRKEPKQ
jgi:hypothetical protein